MIGSINAQLTVKEELHLSRFLLDKVLHHRTARGSVSQLFTTY